MKGLWWFWKASLELAQKSFCWKFQRIWIAIFFCLFFFFSEEVSFGLLRASWESKDSFFMKSFSVSFLLEISPIKVLPFDAVSQPGLEAISCSAASFAASVICFSKSWSSSLLVDLTTIFGSMLGKNSETLSWNLPFWLFHRRKLSILVLVAWGGSLFLSVCLNNNASFDTQKVMHRAAWSLLMLSNFLLTSLVWCSCLLGMNRWSILVLFDSKNVLAALNSCSLISFRICSPFSFL